MCYGKDQKKLIVCKRNENPKTGAYSTGSINKERMGNGNERTQTAQKMHKIRKAQKQFPHRTDSLSTGS